MRTTLTIEEDVAVQLEKIRRDQNVSLKKIVNETLRQGLQAISQKNTSRKRFRTKSVSLGNCLISNLDDVADALSIAEGENFK